MSSSLDIAATPLGGGVVAGYHPPPGVFDELFNETGSLRPQWQKFITALDAMGPHDLARRWDQAKRLIHENGVTYNVYGDPQRTDRPWELDALPLVFPAAEWNILAVALVQRARLLNELLVDIYGQQTVLREGLLPPELVFAHPGFLLSCHGSRVPQDTYLHLYAAHLARRPDGRWTVLADRTQAPNGAGYAVENRIVISRTLPNKFHESQVQRLAGFFLTLRETLQSLATHHRDNPRIVLLSPGPQSTSYFEDTYLARYLGYTMVEGGDLMVRDNIVFLKTLGGLLPVDVILRRVIDDYCDPLELRGDSLLGVPGLVQAARRNHVVIANALGSGMIEAPVLQSFLPALCRRFLGEDLQLPSVETWWCARPDDLRYVLEHFEQLVIKPAFSSHSAKAIFIDQLTKAQREELAGRIRARPREFVAQERVTRSSAPVWNGREMEPWHVALRTFLVASGDSYQVMPGGLPRVSKSSQSMSESMTSGQGSKDVWVLSEGPVAPVSLLRPHGAPIELRRSGNDLPSRVADNLYWLGRQVERVEGAVRLLRSVVSRLTSETDPAGLPDLDRMLHSLTDTVHGPSEPTAEELRHALQPEVYALVFDEHRPGSLRKTLNMVHQLASVVRDRISLDMWRILNLMDRDVEAPKAPEVLPLSDVLSMLNQTVVHLAAFSGLGMESMTRGPGWRFLDMGRRLERAVHTMRLLRNTLSHVTRYSHSMLEALLEIADSSMTYRSRYLTTLQLPPLLDLILTDETNPRSVAFQVQALAEHVSNLPRDQSQPVRSQEQRLILAAQTNLRLADVETLCEVEKDGSRTQLERFLARLATQLRKLSESVSHTYLIHAGPSRQLGEIVPGVLR